MTTPIFAALMAAWWLAAETALVLGLEWASRHVRGPRPVLWLSRSSFILIVVAIVGFGAIALRYFWIRRSGMLEPEMRFWNMTIWNGLCTLWVSLEIAILLYLRRTVRVLEGKDESNDATLFIVAACIVALFLFYHHEVRNLILSMTSERDRIRIENLLIFYIRFCGLFWVILEGGCAYWVYRGRKLLQAKLA